MKLTVESVVPVPKSRGWEAAPLAFLRSEEGAPFTIGGHGAVAATVFTKSSGQLISLAIPEGSRGDEKAFFIGRRNEASGSQPVIERLQLLPAFSTYCDLEYLENLSLSRVLYKISRRVDFSSAWPRIRWTLALGSEDVLLSLQQHLAGEVWNLTHVLVLWKSGLTSRQVESAVPGFFGAIPGLAEVSDPDLQAWLNSPSP